MSALRPPTAFELFLQRRQQVASESNAASELRSPFNLAASAPADLTHALLPAPVAAAAASAPAAAPAASSATPRAIALRAPQGRPLPSNSNSSPPDRPSSRLSIRRSAPNLIPQVVASLPSPRLSAADGQAAAGGGGGGGPPLAAVPPSTAVYGELASAAACLASAASKLARGPLSDRSVAASYENLAQAAADLAASACLIRPLTSSNSGGGPHGGSNRRASINLPTKLPETRSGSLGALPRAVDPIAAAAEVAEAATGPITGGGGGGSAGAAAAAAAAMSAHQQQRYQQQQQQQKNSSSAARSAAGSSSAGVRRSINVPRFPGYNPLIHLMESSMPPPGTAASQRPTTSSPITHQLADSRALLQSAAGGGGGNASAASSLSYRQRRRSSSSAGPGSAAFPPRRSSADGAAAAASVAGGGRGNGPLFFPANLSRLPVLTIGADGEYMPSGGFGAATPPAAAAGGYKEVWFNDQGGGAGSGATSQHGGDAGAAHRQQRGSAGGGGASGTGGTQSGPPRLSEWPGPGPLLRSESLPSADWDQEEVDGRYNKLLAALRERVYARGANRVASVFRDLDRDGSGVLCRKDFVTALQTMNLGPSGLIDDKVVDLMLAAVDGGATGWRPLHVPYGDFVNALRFGTLPWRDNNRKLLHRQMADPDQPIGPPKTGGGLPPYSLAYGNNNNNNSSPSGGGASAAAAAGAAATAGGGGGGAAAAACSGRVSRLGKLRLAFRQVDHNGDGVVEWEEFREALRRVGEQNRLQLSDQQLLKIYEDADPDFSTGVDYEAFVEAYGSADGPTAASPDRLPEVAVTSHTYSHRGVGGGGDVSPGSLTARSYRSQDLPPLTPRSPQSPQPPPPITPLIPLYDELDKLRCTGSADGLPARGGGGGRGGAWRRGPVVHWQLGTGSGSGGAGTLGGGSWWNTGNGGGGGGGSGHPLEALRDMHAGAAAVLRRLGSTSGTGRAAVRI